MIWFSNYSNYNVCNTITTARGAGLTKVYIVNVCLQTFTYKH